jgi:hypothetical protein
MFQIEAAILIVGRYPGPRDLFEYGFQYLERNETYSKCLPTIEVHLGQAPVI